MTSFTHQILRAGCEARLKAIADELAQIVAIDPEIKRMAAQALRPIIKGAYPYRKPAPKVAKASLIQDLHAARARRASAPAPEPPRPKRKPMSDQQKERLRRVMRARWRAAKLAGRNLQDGFKHAEALAVLAARKNGHAADADPATH